MTTSATADSARGRRRTVPAQRAQKPVASVSATGPCAARAAALAAGEGAGAEEAEHRREQRDGGDGGERDRQRGADRHAVQEGQPEDEHAEQRHDDGSGGEQHGPSGRRHGRGHRFLHAASGAQPGAVAGDDEQGVVDADAEPDQRAERGGEVGERERVAEQAHRQDRGAEPGDGGDEREDHREQRPERQEQHDGGRDDADEFGGAGARFADPGEGRAAELDADAVGGAPRGGVGDALDVVRRERLGLRAERDVGVGGAAVPADLPLRARHVRSAHVPDPGEAGDLVERGGHLLPDGRVADRPALRAPHDGGGGSGLFGRCSLEQFESRLGLGSG
nr:hypothetical protein [Actinomadura sp. CNU-125]